MKERINWYKFVMLLVFGNSIIGIAAGVYGWIFIAIASAFALSIDKKVK